MEKYFLGALLFLINSSVSFADENRVCTPQSYPELIQCYEKNALEISVSNQQLKSAEKLEDVASAWPNPELEAETVSDRREKSETSASLFFTVRLGGKKQALLNEARDERDHVKATRDLTFQQSRLKAMLKTYRLLHLKNEIEILSESITLFTRIVKQLEKRAALTPEQKVSVSIFKMAQADHELRLTQLKSNEESLYQDLNLQSLTTRASIEKNLPQRKDRWPEIELKSDLQSSAQMRQSEAEARLARSRKEKADSEAWPDFKVGPSIRFTKEISETTQFVGVGFSMPLPIFSLNGGQKSFQRQKQIEAELSLEKTKKETFASQQDLFFRYTQMVQSLKKTLSFKSIIEKHRQAEDQFFKGLISGSLVIEVHRQLFDFEERRNATELEALETYGHLLILQNKFNEVYL